MDNTHSNDNDNAANSEWRNREMGALWKKEGKAQKFYSGMVKIDKGTDNEREVPIVVFLNKLKQENERAPELIIYQSKDTNTTVKDHDELPDSFIT